MCAITCQLCSTRLTQLERQAYRWRCERCEFKPFPAQQQVAQRQPPTRRLRLVNG